MHPLRWFVGGFAAYQVWRHKRRTPLTLFGPDNAPIHPHPEAKPATLGSMLGAAAGAVAKGAETIFRGVVDTVTRPPIPSPPPGQYVVEGQIYDSVGLKNAIFDWLALPHEWLEERYHMSQLSSDYWISRGDNRFTLQLPYFVLEKQDQIAQRLYEHFRLTSDQLLIEVRGDPSAGAKKR